MNFIKNFLLFVTVLAILALFSPPAEANANDQHFLTAMGASPQTAPPPPPSGGNNFNQGNRHGPKPGQMQPPTNQNRPPQPGHAAPRGPGGHGGQGKPMPGSLRPNR